MRMGLHNLTRRRKAGRRRQRLAAPFANALFQGGDKSTDTFRQLRRTDPGGNLAHQPSRRLGITYVANSMVPALERRATAGDHGGPSFAKHRTDPSTHPSVPAGDQNYAPSQIK